MIITREKGMRMWGGGSGSTSSSGVNGGGGFSLAVTEGEGTGNAYTDFTYESGILTLNKGSEFVTVDFFNKLFTAYDANGNVIAPNNTTPTLDNIKFKAGAWTEQYLSALGQNSSGGGGGGGIELSDVWQSLKTNTDDYANQKINSAHIPDLSGTYATKTWVNQQGFVTSSGVTSVAMTVPTGLSVSGTPITSTGTLALAFATGYSIPTTAKQSNWDTAFGWGNHASAGYASASSVTTLQGYFTNGVANTAAKLNTGTTTYSVWGQNYWQNGVPKSVSNTYMSGVTNIDSLLYFDTTNSRVGIATSSPISKLHVIGNAQEWSFHSYGSASSSNFTSFYAAHGSGIAGMWCGVTSTSSSSSHYVAQFRNGITDEGSGGNVVLQVAASGNVGIGIESPSYKLHVNGYTSTTRLYLSSSVYLEYDSSKSGVHLVGAGFYSDSYVSALGSNSSGGGSGTFDEEAMWVALGTTISAKKISNNYLNLASWAKASSKPSYTFSEIGSKPTTLSGYGVLADADGRYYALYGGTPLTGTSSSHYDLNNLLTVGSYYCGANTTAAYIDHKPIGNNLAFRIWVSATTGFASSTYLRQRFQAFTQVAIYERTAVNDDGLTSNDWGDWYLVQNNLANYASASSLNNYLPLTGGTLTGTLTAPKIRINTRHGSSDTSGGIYYYNGTTDYLLIGQGSTNLWIGANETNGTHHAGSTYISAGSGQAYISRLVDSTRTNYKILDKGNTYVSSGTGYIDGTAITTISGNAATATTLATARYIWGQSFNGSADIPTTAIAKMPYVNFKNYNDDGDAGYCGRGSSTTNDIALVAYSGNQLILGSNGSALMYLSTSNNVGIGTSSPSSQLHVIGNAQEWSLHSYGSASSSNFTSFYAAHGSGVAGMWCGVSSTSTSSYIAQFRGGITDEGSGGNVVMNIMANGKVGINTETPSSNLTVDGTITCRCDYYSNTNPSLGNLDVGTVSIKGATSDGKMNKFGCYIWLDTTSGATKFQGGYEGGLSTNTLPIVFQPLGGRVGIGTHSPSYPLHVVGNIYGSSEITAASDERKKNIISNTKFNVKDIASARSIIYEWNDDRDKDNEKKMHGGSIAQDWLGKADSFLSQDNDGFYSINYGALALCSAITIAREVVKHEDRITLLEKENARLKARVEELEERRA